MCCPISFLYWCLFHNEFEKGIKFSNPDDYYKNKEVIPKCRKDNHKCNQPLLAYKPVEIILPKLRKIFKYDTCAIYYIIDILCKAGDKPNRYSCDYINSIQTIQTTFKSKVEKGFKIKVKYFYSAWRSSFKKG